MGRRALEFQGNAGIEIPNSDDWNVSHELTMTMFIRMDTDEDRRTSLVHRDWARPVMIELRDEPPYRLWGRSLGTISSSESVSVPNVIPQGETVAIAYRAKVIDDTDIDQRLYVDGNQVGHEIHEDFGIIEESNDPMLFASGENAHSVADGAENLAMDDIRFYNRALDESEIKALANGKHIQENLVSWWPLDDGAVDKTGDNDGTLVDGPDVVGPVRPHFQDEPPALSALEFNDDDQCIITESSIFSTEPDEFTVTVWFKVTSDKNGYKYILIHTNPDNGNLNEALFSFHFDDGELMLRVDGSSRSTGVMASDLIGKINMLSLVFNDDDSVEYRLNLDLLVNVLEPIEDHLAMDREFTIGGHPERGERFYDDPIDDVRIYNRALSESEIQTLYKGEHIHDGLVGWWPLDEIDGNTTYDYSGHGNDGTLIEDPEEVESLMYQELYEPGPIQQSIPEYTVEDSFAEASDDPVMRWIGFVEQYDARVSTRSNRFKVAEDGEIPSAGTATWQDNREDFKEVSMDLQYVPQDVNMIENFLGGPATSNDVRPLEFGEIIPYNFSAEYRRLLGCVGRSFSLNISEDDISSASATFLGTEYEDWSREDYIGYGDHAEEVDAPPLSYSDLSNITYGGEPIDGFISGLQLDIDNTYKTYREPDSELSTRIDTLMLTERDIRINLDIVYENTDITEQILEYEPRELSFDIGETAFIFEGVQFPESSSIGSRTEIRGETLESDPVKSLTISSGEFGVMFGESFGE